MQSELLYTLRIIDKDHRKKPHVLLLGFHKFFYLIFGNEAEYMFEDAYADDLVAFGGLNRAHAEQSVVLDVHLGGKVEFADQTSNG